MRKQNIHEDYNGFFGKWENGKWDFFEIFFVGLFIFWKWKNGEFKKKRIPKFPGSKNEVAENAIKSSRAKICAPQAKFFWAFLRAAGEIFFKD